MAKVVKAFGAMGGIDHRGKRYIAKDGIFDVPDHVAADLIKWDGCFSPANKPRGVTGVKCSGCGFHGYFTKCGRCGALTER